MQRSSETARPSNVPLIMSSVVLILLVVILALFVPGDWWQVVVLGIVEGVTEFLPISSTAHLLITSQLLKFQGSIGGTFEIFIQFGAVLAVLGYYVRDLLRQVTTIQRDPAVQRLWLGVLIGFVPFAAIAFVLRKWVKSVLYETPSVIAWALILGGIVFLVVELLPKRKTTTHKIEEISLVQAFLIGISQVIALIPGVSRSGASIVTGLLVGVDRPTVTTFTFYLAIPTLGAATVVDLLGSLDQITTNDVARLALGTIISMIVAWLSIDWLLRYVSRNSFVAFGIYRILAGIVLLVLAALRVV